jgi:hypothetical protein
MVDHGIDVVGVEWAAFHDEADLVPSQWDADFRAAALPELANRPLKWVLLYDLDIRFRRDIGLDFSVAEVHQRLLSDFSRFADANEPYFHDSKYLKLEGRPVIYIYISRDIAGSITHIANAFASARNALAARGFPQGAYVVADHLDYGRLPTDTLQAIGAHAVSAFIPISPNEGIPQDPNPTGPPSIQLWANKINTELYSPARVALADTDRRYDLTPGIFPQYDDVAFRDGGECEADPPRSIVQRYQLRDASDWRRMIDQAGLPHQLVALETTITPTCDVITTRNTSTSILWVYSYNEWGEGTGIEELDGSGTYPFAFGTQLLATLHDAVGGGGGPTAAPPAPVQRNPEGYVDGLRPLFLWDAVPYGDQYRLEIDGPGGTEAHDVSNTTFVPPSSLIDGGEYA